ncbi:bifunctional folylpolyglutamate synthase/dihydrofolate synthase [Vulgatibacter sp.]|uniref:bifunctional folylpolyglutamate synthase/dihydrofolate synthase n=1 Tax=Vulgatibacter sp. TaxID=1971226 RepID=UPI00356339A8
MSAAEAFLAALPQSSIRLGLERVAAACTALGMPQGRYPAILVAGTNGKGSTCAFLARALQAAGLRVGLYTSPHLVSCRERIRVDGAPIAAADLDAAVERLRAAYVPAREAGHPDALSYFEAMTVLAFDHFARAGIDVAVLEVGLGGRLDATNVPGTDLRATVVTRLGLDHVEWLGPTLEAIAAEKAGIARPDVPLISAPQAPAAAAVLRREAGERGAPLVAVGSDVTLVPGADGLEYEGRSWRIEGISLGLRGGHQAENAAVALATLEACGLPVDADAARTGLREARWPGRIEVVAQAPVVVIDGAHNPDAAAALADGFVHLWPGIRPQLVFGVLADKERAAMMEPLLPLAEAVHLCTPASSRSVPAAQLLPEAAGHARSVQAHGSVAAALEAARHAAGPKGVVLVCGSLYLAGEVRRLLCGDEPAS